jgi:DnaK suppressor protein
MEVEYVYMIGERLRQRLFLIEEALDAIENGDYGICAECEEPINEKRLLLMPFALLCVRCQSEIERQARMRGQLAA